MDIDVDVLSNIIGCKSDHKKLDYLAERIWLAEGKECDVIYLDEGNGICRILQILPKEDKDKKCLRIFEKYIRLVLDVVNGSADKEFK